MVLTKELSNQPHVTYEYEHNHTETTANDELRPFGHFEENEKHGAFLVRQSTFLGMGHFSFLILISTLQRAHSVQSLSKQI